MGLYGTLSQAIQDTVTSVVGITTSVRNVVDAANHATAALKFNAAELEDDAVFECKKKAHTRAVALKAFTADIALLEA